MVVNDTTKQFTYWPTVVRLYVQITTGVKTGWDCQPRRTYALYSWYQYFTLVVVKSGVWIGMMITCHLLRKDEICYCKDKKQYVFYWYFVIKGYYRDVKFQGITLT